MAIPAYDEFYGVILALLSDGKVHNSRETIKHCAEAFRLDEEDKSAMLPSDRKTILANRVSWARTYLKKAGLIMSPTRGKYKITDIGMKAAKEKEEQIDNKYLLKFKSFRDFMKVSELKEPKKPMMLPDSESESTPQEIINAAYQKITLQTADELMTNIMGQDPAFFERLVMDLLEKMGYGGELENPAKVTGKTGDEGIDGIIRQDTLGFDKIYVQAKRWDNSHPVGGPDIQQFAGALMGKGANKGLFITTSHFSKAARDFVEKHMTAKIVLLDGVMLTQLMINYNLGVSIVHSYEIKRVDSDYFYDEDD
ncbi:restriction endonuclease [Anaeroglobus geminatus]|jgi:restriction system protein|uniref:Putative Mrr restriction system protein n=1 Tax=Anaeroglobus geminatus F0357 TaxID=861450 RepID=G9YHH5_9FIRM|nr:restriction endonuclease [Anaeroglobus geminatus]EHM40765.1 putative Mrr restriction system protein [Anaeroglobus geminatus F0357]